jgi:hypothetical protein
MRWQRLGLAVFMAAAVSGGALVVTRGSGPGHTLRVETPPTLATPAAPPTTLSGDEQIRRIIDAVTAQPLCDGPPVELSDAMARAIEKTLSTLPLPPTVPSEAPGDVVNIHRPLVPC